MAPDLRLASLDFEWPSETNRGKMFEFAGRTFSWRSLTPELLRKREDVAAPRGTRSRVWSSCRRLAEQRTARDSGWRGRGRGLPLALPANG